MFIRSAWPVVIGAALVLVATAAPRGQNAPPPTRVRPTGEVDPASCGQCHGDVTAHDVVHGPVAVGGCAVCHTLTDPAGHRFELARTGAALCTHCHDVALDAPEVHAPLRTGNCTGCHDPHGSTTRALLAADSVSAMCARCHDGVIGEHAHVHGPAAAGACTVCHEPHTASHPSLLRAPARQMCTDCHVETRSQLEDLRFVHGPAAVDCGACHDAHATDFPMMLRDEPEALCLGCHESVRHTVETASTQHAAVTMDRGCLNCHDPHASNHPRVLRNDMKTLCYECHDQEIALPNGKMLANIKAIIEGGTSLHGPVAQDNCAACHMIHGGDHFRLLTQEYPAEFYAPFAEESYALCFSCHDRQLVYDARTTALTDFRNGDLNLHYLHVNRDKKGRTCRACHETHASIKAKHIRESVPFGSGGWELPIGFEKTPTGGSCAPGCHKPFAYDRDAPVVYPEVPGTATWPKGPGQ